MSEIECYYRLYGYEALRSVKHYVDNACVADWWILNDKIKDEAQDDNR